MDPRHVEGVARDGPAAVPALDDDGVPGVDVPLRLHPQLGEVLRQPGDELQGPLTTAVDATEGDAVRGGPHDAVVHQRKHAGGVAGREGRVAGAGQVHIAVRGDIRRIGGGDDAGLRREDLVRRLEGDLREDVQAERCHSRAEALLAERVERGLALPAVEVVTVLPLPPGQLRQPSVRPPFQPARRLPDGVVLLPGDPAQNDLGDDCHVEPPWFVGSPSTSTSAPR